MKAGALSRYPDVLTMEEQSVDEDALWAVDVYKRQGQEKLHFLGKDIQNKLLFS